MQYSVEELGTLKKKVSVTIPAADVDQQIARTSGEYRASVSIQGFRKGKAPLSVVERRFGKDIYSEVARNLADQGVRGAVDELKLEPASRMSFDTPELKKGADFVFSFTLDVMPDFELPEYQDFPLDEEEVVISDEDINEVIEKARKDLAELVDVDDVRKAVDGEVVLADFEGFDSEGKPYAGLTASEVLVSLGDNQTLPDFEELVKSLSVGEQGEKDIYFPEDFQNFDLAGQTFKIKGTIRGIKQRKLPELDNDFAAKLGKFENMDAAREAIRSAMSGSRKNLAKSLAQKNLLDALLEKVDFPLPDALMSRFSQLSEMDLLEKMHREGKLDEKSIGNLDDVRKQAADDARPQVKAFVFLYKVAKKEDVKVTEGDLVNELQAIAMRTQRQFADVRDEYLNNDMLGALQERIQSAKALELLYSKAKINYVKAAEAETQAAAE